MAQLKDSIVSGNLRVTDEVLTDTVQANKIKAPTTSGGSTYGVGSNGQVLKSNGTSSYWGDDNNSGDVTGPSSATVNDIATFNNTNGKVIKDSGYTFSSGSTDTTATHVVLCNDTRLSNSRQPTSHSHGNIQNGGTISSTAVTPTSTDYLLISDTSSSGKIERGVAIGTDTTKYLRNDGTWVKPPNTEYTGTGNVSVNASTHVISTTAEVNQNAFSNVKVGDTTVAADSKTDTIELVADKGIELTPDATNDKVTIKNNQQGIYTVIGTQTAATGTWTGALHGVSALYDGLTIMYYIPWAVPSSTQVTLNLTLDDGTTTGAVNCYYHTSRLTTHYAKGSNIVMTYWSAGSIKVDGTATTDNRWIANANYDSNSNDTGYYLRRIYPNIKAGSNKIFPYTLIMQLLDGRWESIVTSSSSGTSKARNTHGFLLTNVLLMNANATYNENAAVATYNIWHEHTGLIDHRYSFNTANDATNGTTGYKPVYIVGSLGSDGLFYLDTKWWTQTLPSSEDGKLYIYIGDAYDYYRLTFVTTQKIYYYKQGAVREFAQHSATTDYAIGGMDPLCIPGTNVTAEGRETWPSGDYSHAEGDETTAFGMYSHAEGGVTYAGLYSHAEGSETSATGQSSHSEGSNTKATGNYSHAEGYFTKTTGKYSHAEGGGWSSNSITLASGDYSHAEGYCTSSYENGSHTEGYTTYASGEGAHAEGYLTCVLTARGAHTEGFCTIVSAEEGHAEGAYTYASASRAHAEGCYTSAMGCDSHAEGGYTSTDATYSHAEGYATSVGNSAAHSEGTQTYAGGNSSHTEGYYTSASGNYAHAEGSGTSTNYLRATGEASHAEGQTTIASGIGSHAEGGSNIALGDYSHAEGYGTTANATNAHTEGHATSVSGNHGHAEGYQTYATSLYTHVEGYQSHADGNTSHAEGYQCTASAQAGHAEGYGNIAGGKYNHAEGYLTVTAGNYSHAEGSATSALASGSHAEGENNYVSSSAYDGHAEGYQTSVLTKQSHAEGNSTSAVGQGCHAEGIKTSAIGNYSHTEGNYTYANGAQAHAEGKTTTASNDNAHAEGELTIASGKSSHTEGIRTTASNNYSHASGHFCAAMTTGGDYNNKTGTAFVIGNGTSASALSNAFSVQFSGVVKAASTITASTTADYAEYFEWYDGNSNNEDRVGYFITLENEDKIRIANSNDDYILGITSGEPFVLGNGDCDVWNGMVMRDDFRRVIYEPAPLYKINEKTGKEEPVFDEKGNQIYQGKKPVYNPEYNPSRPYINRADRPEWCPVGMLGVLAVRDDGTCKVNEYCTINDNGIATKANKNSILKYRVLKRKNTNVIEVIFR